jgi:hypothetical protein
VEEVDGKEDEEVELDDENERLEMRYVYFYLLFL